MIGRGSFSRTLSPFTSLDLEFQAVQLRVSDLDSYCFFKQGSSRNFYPGIASHTSHHSGCFDWVVPSESDARQVVGKVENCQSKLNWNQSCQDKPSLDIFYMVRSLEFEGLKPDMSVRQQRRTRRLTATLPE